MRHAQVAFPYVGAVAAEWQPCAAPSAAGDCAPAAPQGGDGRHDAESKWWWNSRGFWSLNIPPTYLHPTCDGLHPSIYIYIYFFFFGLL